MSAEILRRAARLLGERVAELPERLQDEVWEQDSSEIYTAHSHKWVGEALHDEGAMVAYYIELMHPPVALALGALLLEFADSVDQEGGVVQDSGTAGAIEVARAILREDQ